MKEIKLNQNHITPFRKGKGYSIHLGNGTSNTFPSKAKAREFIGITNTFTTTYFHRLHILYTDVVNKYQANWFNFQSPRTNKKGINLSLKELDLKQFLLNAECSLTLSHERSHHINGNYFVFTHLLNAAESLDESIRLLGELSDLRNNRNEVYILDDFLSRKQVIQFELERYGKFSTTKFFKVPTHITQDRNWKPDYTDLKIVA